MTANTVGTILNCNSRKCEFCHKRNSLDVNPYFYSNCGDTQFCINFDVTCQTKTCIYLISCKTCDLKYVGQTKVMIRQRFNWHRAHIRQGTEAKLMLEHFKGNNGCKISDMKIKPIELCDSKKLNERERYWIKELNTLFPYGLNMDGREKGFQDTYGIVVANASKTCIYEYFNNVGSKRSKKGGRNRGRNRNVDNYISPDIQEWVDEYASIDKNKSTHKLRTAILKLKLCDIKKLYIYSVEAISWRNISKPSHKHFMYIVKDICLYKIRSSVPSKVYDNKHFLPIKFVNKLVENVNLQKLFKKDTVCNSFPVRNCAMAKPTISYSRDKAIWTKVLNYNLVVRESTYQTYNCKCDAYPLKFRDPHHGHIITGDLDIVTHNELKELLKKGLNFHEQQPPNKISALNSIKSGVDAYISRASDKLNVPVVQFSEWKHNVISGVENNLERCKSYKFNNVLSKRGPKDALQKLQADFAITPVDKAASNVSFICKAYYVEILNHEVTGSGTFIRSNSSPSQVISDIKHSKYVKNNNNDSLPTLYATTKMHKNPPGFRFITAGRDTILQSLSRNVGKCLNKLIQVSKTFAQYRIKEIDNCVFIIDNRDIVLSFLCSENYQNPGKKQLSTWDFSTLYTKIPHRQLKSNVQYFIRKVFSFMDKEYINSSQFSKKAYFSKNGRNKNDCCFNMHQLIEAVFFIIDNSYICFQNHVFRQIIGIPMGTNCAPHLANIYLHIYEYKYLQKLVNEGQVDVAKKLSKVYRYQDDCIAIDDDNLFATHAARIYPPEMILKKTNVSPNKGTFLDLSVSIYRQKFLYYSWDKRRDFNFPIVNYPDLSGNIPSSQSYGVYTSQLIRFCDINMTFCHFFTDIQQLTEKFMSQSFDSNKLRDKLILFRNSYFFKWAKYGVDISSSINKLFGKCSAWF